MLGKIINQFIFQFGNYILPFLIIPFLIDKLSLNIYKDFVVIQTLVIFFAVLISYGLDLFGVRYISLNISNEKKRIEFVSISLISRLLMFLFFSIFLFLALYFLTDRNSNFWIFGFFWLSSFIFQLNWYLQGVGDFRRITLYGLIPKLILYPLVFLFVKDDGNAWVYLFLCGLANYFSNLSMLIHIFLTSSISVVDIKNIKKKISLFFRRGWFIFLSQASVNLLSYANIFVLPLILDTKSFVVFSTADRIVKVLSISTTPVLNVLFPYISKLAHKEGRKAFLIISRVALTSIALFLCCYALYYLVGAFILEKTFPKISVELHSTLSFLLLNVIFVFLNNLYGTQIGINWGRDKAFSSIIAINGSISISLMAFLGYYFRLDGVIFSSLLVQVSILICMFILARKCGYKFEV